MGSAVSSSGTTQTLAERWRGSDWVDVTTPSLAAASSSSLSSVSCPAANACIAVGYDVNGSGAQQMLAERWDGSAWSLLPAPSSAAELTRVSCSAANACTALAPSGALVYRWNGSGWSSQTLAVPIRARSVALNGVSCSSASDCIAVGQWYGVLCNNGQPSCNCFRVPYCRYGNWRLAEQWNGSAWTIQTSPGLGILSDVSCPSAGCVAVGAIGSTLIAEQWANGGAWEETLPLSTRLGTGMSSVSCTSVDYCVAVGYIATSSGAQMTLAEEWDFNLWLIQPTPPNPYGALNSHLTGVSCTAFSACTAVGYYQNQANVDVPLTERFSG